MMSENPLEAIERLEKLAAWHRINAERAGADWVWEARLRAAEDLERRAAKIRRQLSSGSWARAPLFSLSSCATTDLVLEYTCHERAFRYRLGNA
jgi:hypothetical protein